MSEKHTPSGSSTPNTPKQKKYLFDNPMYVKLVIRALLVLCAVTVLLDAVIHRHHDHPWEAMFAFYPVYGFVSCVLLVLAAKQLRKVVMRAEDYYDEYPIAAPDGGPDILTGVEEIDHGGEHIGHASDDFLADEEREGNRD
jgi:hypothetical protein